jgi:hypothetical protein
MLPPGAWMFVCCVLSGRGLCDELITRPEESYRLWCVVVCDLEITKIFVNEEEAKAHWGAVAPREKKTKHANLFSKEVSFSNIISRRMRSCFLGERLRDQMLFTECPGMSPPARFRYRRGLILTAVYFKA